MNITLHKYQTIIDKSPARFKGLIAGIQCIEENEFIYGPNGLRRVGELKNGDEILGGAVSDLHSFEDQIFELRFNNGMKIKLNREHPIYCRVKGKEDWFKVEELVKLFEERTFGIKVAEGFFYESKDFNLKNDFELKGPKFLGYMTSDGTWAKNQSAKFTNINPIFLKEMESLVCIFQEVKPRFYKKGKGWDILFTTGDKGTPNPVNRYMYELGITRDTFGKIQEAPDEQLKEFIAGYFNGNGYLVNNKRKDRRDISILAFCIGISRRKALEFQYILWRLGIRSHLKEEWMTKSTRPFYRLVVDSNSINKIVSFLDKSKYPKKFENVNFGYGTRNNDKWITLSSIKSIGKGKVVGFETTTHEIITYLGLKTHNSGKSFYGAFWLGLRAIKYPDKNHLLLFPTYKLGQQSTLPKFFELWPHFTETYRKQDGVIELPEGGKIFIRSAERPYSLEGMTVKSAWLDEAGQMQRLVWVVVQARLAIEHGEAVLTSTPYSSNWFDHEFYRLAEGGNKDYFCVQYSSADSPYFPPEEQERMRKILTEEEYDMRYRGLFRKYAGLVYRDFDRNTHVISEDKFWEMRKTGDWRLFRSIDWGYNDPFAAIWVAVDKDKNFYIYAEHYQAMKPTDYHVETINRMSEGEKYEFTIGDSANPQMLEDFRRKGFSIVGSMKGNMANAEQSGISLVRDHLRLQSNGKPRLFVIDTCVNTIDEFESYRYPEPRDEKNQDQRPLDFNNHIMDCTRYLIHKYYAPTVKKEKEWNVPAWARERYGIKNQNRFSSMYKI